MRNAQISAPVSRTPAEIKKGRIQNPGCTRAPKMMGDRDAAKLPAHIHHTADRAAIFTAYVHRHGPCGANHQFQEELVMRSSTRLPSTPSVRSLPETDRPHACYSRSPFSQ